MTKRIVPILLALSLLLSACSKAPQDVTEQSCSTILQVMLEEAGPDAAECGFKVTLGPRSVNTFVLD